MKKNVAPTRTNLMSLKEELSFSKLGHDLLDQKRSILISELLSLVDQAAEHQNRLDYALKDAYKTLQDTVLRQGRLKTGNVAASVNIESDFELGERKIMGVHLPKVETSFVDHGPYFSPEGTSILVDQAVEKFRQVLELMGYLAELKVSIMRLAKEVKKTVRKVNSLEKIVIPDTSAALAEVSERIEETERESSILLKFVKKNLEKKEGI